MKLTETIYMAMNSLRVHRLRSVLTLLGIVVGVMTIITVMSFIIGLNDFVEKEIFNLGADVFVVNRTNNIIISPEDWIAARKRKNLLLDDAKAVRIGCSECSSVGARLTANARVKHGRDYVEEAQVRGVTKEISEILAEDLGAGRGITDYDVTHNRLVCVLGADVADYLFPLIDPLGKLLQINALVISL